MLELEILIYELAKQLKDAGFPQRIDQSSGVEKLLGGVPYSPTLSELIAACADKDDPVWFDLHYYPDSSDRPWQADSGAHESRYNFYGFTPEEVVAQLWLAIHSK